MLIKYYDPTKQFHVLDSKEKKLVASSDEKAEAIDYANNRAIFHERDFHIHETIIVVKSSRCAASEKFSPSPVVSI